MTMEKARRVTRLAPRPLSTAASALASLPPLPDGHKRLYLIRHGETDWNTENRIQGSTDKSLNAVGLRQADALRRYLADAPIELIASSHLRRAAQTADAVAAAHPRARNAAAGVPLRCRPRRHRCHHRFRRLLRHWCCRRLRERHP